MRSNLFSVSDRPTTPFGHVFTPGRSLLSASPSGTGVLLGGGRGLDCRLIAAGCNKNSGAAAAERLINSGIQYIENHGKKLSEDTKKKIQAHLAKYKESENEVLRALCYIDEFNQLIDVFDGEGPLTEENMKKFVANWKSLSGKQFLAENQILKLLGKLDTEISKDTTFSPIQP